MSSAGSPLTDPWEVGLMFLKGGKRGEKRSQVGHLKSRQAIKGRCCLAHYITSRALVGSVYKVMGQLADWGERGKNGV